MRKILLMETRATDEFWPTKKIEETQTQLYAYLDDFIPDKWLYSKHAIMGPVGKLLGIIAASKFGDNTDPYVGYIANIHDQQSKKRLTPAGMANLKSAVTTLLTIRKEVSERAFLKILSSVDYAVYYLKVKEISERSEAKKMENRSNE
jgi:hypothetical protein